MLFCRDLEEKGWLWAQRPDDENRVDRFHACNYCAQMAEMRVEENKWGESDLCQPCETNLEITRAINDVRGADPEYMDNPLVRIIREYFNEE